MSRVLAVLLIMGLLIGCETTGHVSSTSSEEAVSAKIISPEVEEEVFEPEIEEIDIVPTVEELVLQEEEAPEGVSQEERKDSLQEEQPAEELEQVASSVPSVPKEEPALPSPQAPASVEPPKAELVEPVLPKKLQDIYFDFDQASILNADKPVLETNGSLLKGHFKHLNVLIEGHCDERGSVEYNLVLGVRRAQVVKGYLMDLGIPESRIRIVSFGKERPVCTQQNETCWQKNRRAHFVLQ